MLPEVELPELDVSFVEGVNLSTSRTADIDVVLPAARPPLGPPEVVVDEWLPTWLVPKSPVNATARFDGAELALRVVADPVGFPAGERFAEV